jgi:hypothetical protein
MHYNALSNLLIPLPAPFYYGIQSHSIEISAGVV